MQVKCRTTIQSIWTLLPPNPEISSAASEQVPKPWPEVKPVDHLCSDVYVSLIWLQFLIAYHPPVDLCSLTHVLPKTLPKRKKLHLFNGFFGGKVWECSYLVTIKTKNVKTESSLCMYKKQKYVTDISLPLPSITALMILFLSFVSCF